MYALTLWEPWATLIMLRVKHFETRPWALPARLEGKRLAIHAAKRTPPHEYEQAMKNQHICEALWADIHQIGMRPGCILGTVTIGKCFHTEDIRTKLSEAELAFGDYSDGRYAFEVYDVMRFTDPTPARGYQKFWNWEEPSI